MHPKPPCTIFIARAKNPWELFGTEVVPGHPLSLFPFIGDLSRCQNDAIGRACPCHVSGYCTISPKMVLPLLKHQADQPFQGEEASAPCRHPSCLLQDTSLNGGLVPYNSFSFSLQAFNLIQGLAEQSAAKLADQMFCCGGLCSSVAQQGGCQWQPCSRM